MIRLSILTFALACAACAPRDYSPSEYLSEDEQQRVLIQAVKYVYYTEGIPAAARFSPEYHDRYLKVLPAFYIYRYAKADDAELFFIIRKYASGKWRGTGGRMKLDTDMRIVEFEELFVTPLSGEEKVREKGDFLFQQLARKGVVAEEYLKMRSYVEWPDASTTYDKIKHEWVRTN